MKRVVVTGLGVLSPNAVEVDNFVEALKSGKSGIQYIEELERLNFGCKVGGIPPLTDEIKNKYFNELQQKMLQGTGLTYGAIAAKEAWKHAGLEENPKETNWDSGCVFGGGHCGIEVVRDGIYKVDDGNVKRIGSVLVQQTMESVLAIRFHQIPRHAVQGPKPYFWV
jgi:3-oxoacyl-(acyl-carrier-protein) synthase